MEKFIVMVSYCIAVLSTTQGQWVIISQKDKFHILLTKRICNISKVLMRNVCQKILLFSITTSIRGNQPSEPTSDKERKHDLPQER